MSARRPADWPHTVELQDLDDDELSEAIDSAIARAGKPGSKGWPTTELRILAQLERAQLDLDALAEELEAQEAAATGYKHEAARLRAELETLRAAH